MVPLCSKAKRLGERAGICQELLGLHLNEQAKRRTTGAETFIEKVSAAVGGKWMGTADRDRLRHRLDLSVGPA